MNSIRGSSLVELSVAMIVGSVVLSGAYQAHRIFTSGAEREKVKTILEQQVIGAGELLAKDIRSAGYGLGGQTITVDLSDNESDKFNVFSNTESRLTKLVVSAFATDTTLLVQSASGITPGWWVSCVNPYSSSLKQIKRIGHSASGNDTLFLSGALVSGPFFTGNTVVRFATVVSYRIIDGNLCRVKNEVIKKVGTVIDTIDLVVLDESGDTLDAHSMKEARSVVISFGGHFGKGASRGVHVENVTVNLRNLQ